MIDAEHNPPRAERLVAAALVAVLHLAIVMALVRGFAPQIGTAIVGTVTSTFDVPILPPSDPPVKSEPKSSSARYAGAAAPAGMKARPREITAPRPEVVMATKVAPSVAADGEADSAGARKIGPGSGAVGVGHGLGAGAAGGGTGGGGGASRPVKIAGDIVSARDYPSKTRDLRLGSAVTVALSVGIDGKVSECRIVRPSRDPDADRITCRLATQRFRFRPALDGNGHAVASTYGWQQRWFAPPGE